ncbi:MAG: METTL5 family protein [Candidatus Helarchaeota archaeon]
MAKIDRPIIARKNLEIILQKLDIYPSPQLKLEQYPIDAKSAANILYFASFNNQDIYNKIVLDFGCGTGRLAIGASLLGAKKVIGIDIDPLALEIAEKNANKVNCKNIEWIEEDISICSIRGDTIIQNPPFGVQNKGNDLKFLKKALELGKSIYSFHKSGNRNRSFLKKNILKLGGKIDSIIEMELTIPYQFEFHKKKSYKVKVDLWRIIK